MDFSISIFSQFFIKKRKEKEKKRKKEKKEVSAYCFYFSEILEFYYQHFFTEIFL